jgi:hypothetical protein
MLTAYIPDQIAPRRHLSSQRGPSVLRDPHQMQVDFGYSAPPRHSIPKAYPAHALKAIT